MFESICRIFDLKLVLIAGILSAVYLYVTWTHSYWFNLGVFSPSKPVPFFGNAMPSILGQMHFMDVLHDLYQKLGDQRFGGIYTMRTPQLLVKDPELIGHILVKDFNNFTDRGLYAGTESNPLNNNIFFTRGERWRTMRQKLSPTFTANKLKHMNEQVKECTSALLSKIGMNVTVEDASDSIEIREMMATYSTDVIGSCAFGLKLDAINDKDSEFRKHGKTVFQPSLRSKIRVAIIFMQPSLLSIFCVHHYSQKTIKFFHDAFRQTIEYREKNKVDRKDFVQHLMKAREDLVLNPNLKPNEKFTEMDIVANAYILFIAGFETVSTSMSFCLYELALKKDIQDKVRNEILEVKAKYNGQMNSESINELHYMSMVIKETLRKYPPLVTLNRVVTKPYVIPETNIKLKTGTKVVIPVHAIHYDSKYYSDPYDFNPERFSEENVHNLYPNTYMPFGDGPRFCIGKRFAEFEMKMALSEVLSNYEVAPCEKTQIPIKYVIGSFVNIPESVWLKFKKIDT
ncbi:Cytochrome P450, E-class, group I,Cytochrome P450,Cytochrome P450, conserved site [Cinara cedri]|uniref:Cytochrome P450, E-class, group I,Cytochrome P450,Cytochrome P450, conserved site n=1 Tax=Cinara cedri TaxID=506608 RepID=A0A5E4NNA3_9HEMI|nr:Cytochrome P450, E-class, group I,Cytochrome P450,Cytochrome P450, conserved site [Cinara cedri]